MSTHGSRRVLVIGASGVIGAAAVERFSNLPGTQVTALSRRRPRAPRAGAFEHLAVDLTNRDRCADAAAGLSDVTHVVYAALFEKPGLVAGWYEADQMATNLAMMRNIMDPLVSSARGLRHVSFLQGTKAYGAHVHRIAVPAREDRARDPHDNFYWLQEDYMRALQSGAPWAFTIWRPQVVFGGALGVAMNLIPVIGVYAAICRELGQPFVCPCAFDNIIEAVDADLIAGALDWATEAQQARGEIFNITNGDVMVWRNVWPAIASAVGLAAAEGDPVSLAQFLPAHAETWRSIVKRHGLAAPDMGEILGESHHYADLLFSYGASAPPASTLVSTIKLRQAGFGDCMDTEAMFAKWFGRLAQERLLPAP